MVYINYKSATRLNIRQPLKIMLSNKFNDRENVHNVMFNG